MSTIKIVISKHEHGFSKSIGCFDGIAPIAAINKTLLSFVRLLDTESARLFEEHLSNKAATNISDMDQADWDINDICCWINRPPAKEQCICFANENTEYNTEDGTFQSFTIDQTLQVVRFWRSFLEELKNSGPDAMHNRSQQIEIDFP